MTDKEKKKKAEEETEKETVKASEETAAEESSQEEAAAENETNPTEPSAEEKLAAEVTELKDKYLRLMAEFDNYRKRSAKERLEIYPEATANAVEAFLPLADNFERAAAAETTDEKYKAGIMMIYTQLANVFTKLGVEEINRVGEAFDPNLENAVNQITDENLGENVVAQVYQKGYRLKDKIIRPAMVCVANA